MSSGTVAPFPRVEISTNTHAFHWAPPRARSVHFAAHIRVMCFSSNCLFIFLRRLLPENTAVAPSGVIFGFPFVLFLNEYMISHVVVVFVCIPCLNLNIHIYIYCVSPHTTSHTINTNTHTYTRTQLRRHGARDDRRENRGRRLLAERRPRHCPARARHRVQLQSNLSSKSTSRQTKSTAGKFAPPEKKGGAARIGSAGAEIKKKRKRKKKKKIRP